MARPKQLNKNTGASELARELGISVSTVSQKRKKGKTDDQIRQEAANWKNRETKEEKRSTEGQESFFEAQRRKEVALASLRELELAMEKGELVKVAEVNAFVSSMILRARDILSRIAPELCDRLAKETDPSRIRELIDAEVLRALTQLSAFRGAQ